MTAVVYEDPPTPKHGTGWSWWDRLAVIAEHAEPGKWVDITASLHLKPLPANGGGPFSAALAAADKRRAERWELCTRMTADGRHLYGRWCPSGCCMECGQRR